MVRRLEEQTVLSRNSEQLPSNKQAFWRTPTLTSICWEELEVEKGRVERWELCSLALSLYGTESWGILLTEWKTMEISTAQKGPKNVIAELLPNFSLFFFPNKCLWVVWLLEDIGPHCNTNNILIHLRQLNLLVAIGFYFCSLD